MPTVSFKFDVRDTVYVTIKDKDGSRILTGTVQQVNVSVTTKPVNDVTYLVALTDSFDGCTSSNEYPEKSLYATLQDAIDAMKF